MRNLLERSNRADILAGQLTQREREVLQLVAEGRTNKGVAAILQIAERTVTPGFGGSIVCDVFSGGDIEWIFFRNPLE